MSIVDWLSTTNWAPFGPSPIDAPSLFCCSCRKLLKTPGSFGDLGSVAGEFTVYKRAAAAAPMPYPTQNPM